MIFCFICKMAPSKCNQKINGGFCSVSTEGVQATANVEVETLPSQTDPEIDASRSWTQACLAPLLFPSKGSSVWTWTYFLFAWPIRFTLCLTTPDCRLPRWRRFQGHWIAFIMSCVWIGIYTILMMWTISIIGK